MKSLIFLLLTTLLTTLLPAQLPDPLINLAGEKVITPAQWQSRRVEIKEILIKNTLGTYPEAPANIKTTITAKDVLSNATLEIINLNYGPENKLILNLLLLKPNKVTKPPIIIFPNFQPIPINSSDLKNYTAPFESALKRGYAVATFYYQEAALDTPDSRKSLTQAAYPEKTWGTLTVWAWTMSRVLDYLETRPELDAKRAIALGHSRLGKAALIAGALDERFALVASAGSGCGGTAAYRFCGKNRGGKEGLEDALAHFPQWFTPELQKYADRIPDLPFDQNFIIALCAPRPLIAADGESDPYTNTNAVQQAILGAQPVYDLLGKKDNLHLSLRPGKHELAKADWNAILDLAEREFFGKKHEK